MNRKRKINPIVLILVAATILVALTLLIVYLVGGRFTTLPNGTKFIGEYKDGQPYSGTLKQQNGTEATLNKETNTITYSNGDIYTGDIINGLRHGNGTMTFVATGDVYVGTFKEDQISGKGVFKYANGDVYDGEVLNSMKHGQGTFTSANGNVYVGYYKNDVRNGKGKFTWASGASYEGEFINDLKNGYGTMIYETGDRYEGNFKNDVRDGEGIYSWTNGERYNGVFHNNVMDTRLVDEKTGQFIRTSDGGYVHGNKGRYTFSTGRIYYGYFADGLAVAYNDEKE